MVIFKGEVFEGGTKSGSQVGVQATNAIPTKTIANRYLGIFFTVLLLVPLVGWGVVPSQPSYL
jgi:hypothetical protein